MPFSPFVSLFDWWKETPCPLPSITRRVTFYNFRHRPFCVDPRDSFGEFIYVRELPQLIMLERLLLFSHLCASSYLRFCTNDLSLSHPDRNMFDEKRYLTSVTYLSCLGATLVIIFIPMPALLKFLIILGLTMAQFCASTWYSLSYIPYGRRTALRLIKRFLSIEDTTNYAGIQVGGGS